MWKSRDIVGQNKMDVIKKIITVLKCIVSFLIFYNLFIIYIYLSLLYIDNNSGEAQYSFCSGLFRLYSGTQGIKMMWWYQCYQNEVFHTLYGYLMAFWHWFLVWILRWHRLIRVLLESLITSHLAGARDSIIVPNWQWQLMRCVFLVYSASHPPVSTKGLPDIVPRMVVILSKGISLQAFNGSLYQHLSL